VGAAKNSDGQAHVMKVKWTEAAAELYTAVVLDALDGLGYRCQSPRVPMPVEEKSKLAQTISKLKVEQESEFNRRLKGELAKAREAHEKDKLLELQRRDASAFKDRQRLEKKVGELQRQLAKRTSNDIGEAAEIDLYDELIDAFPEDDIRRIQKGEAGADIWQDIKDNGKPCGRLIYDSKDRKQWRHNYAAKLKSDQMAAQADHAIVATRVFPQGANQLHMRDGVFLAHPARVRMLATMLREQVVRLAKLQMSNEERHRKVDELYEYINLNVAINQAAIARSTA